MVVFFLMLQEQIHGWDLVSEGGKLKLQRSWKAKSFMKALEFFKLVADVAEAEGVSFLQASSCCPLKS